MTALLVEPAWRAEPPDAAGFEVCYVPGDGVERRVPLTDAWAVRFDEGQQSPVRPFDAA